MKHILLISIFSLIFSGCASTAAPKISPFSKISASGKVLPDDATEWQCVRDNNTHLMWEVKQESGLHDSHAIFSWIEAFEGEKNFVSQVNKVGLCGFHDWQAPTKNDLLTLVDKTRYLPVVNTDYFPKMALGKYWSASKYGYYDLDAWFVDIDFGKTGGDKIVSYGNHVVLVRSTH